MASISDIVATSFRLVSNSAEILKLWDKIIAAIKSVTSVYPELKALVDKLAPGATAPITGATELFSVEWLQEALNKLSNAGLKVDGDYGELTKKAVTAFQQQNGLEVDGWAGVATTAAIMAALEKRK